MITEVYRRTLEAADAAKAEAALQTRRADLTRLLQYKFPKKFDEAAAARLEAVDSQDTLSLWFGHALQAESWKDFAKAAGWRGENGHANGDGPEFEL